MATTAVLTSTQAPVTKVRFAQSWASVQLDLLRAIAALFVLVEHLRNFLFVDYGKLNVAHRFLWILPYALTGLGHQAVVLFFLMSGLLIGRSVIESFRHDSWSWKRYATHRLVRLWIVLLPGLLLCALLDTAGSSWLMTRHMYFGDAGNHMLYDAAKHIGPVTFLGNVAFLQTVLVPVYGSNGALWSLANEFWYYVLFPLGVVAILKSRRLVERVICAALFVSLCIWLRSTLLPMFPIWLGGVLISQLPTKRTISKPLFTILGVVHLIITVGLAEWRSAPRLLVDYLYAIASAFLLWSILSLVQLALQSRHVKLIRFAARGSYSLYLMHMPFVAFCAALLLHGERWQPTVEHLVVATIVGVSALTYVYFVGFLTEFRTDKVRRWVESLVQRRQETNPCC